MKNQILTNYFLFQECLHSIDVFNLDEAVVKQIDSELIIEDENSFKYEFRVLYKFLLHICNYYREINRQKDLNFKILIVKEEIFNINLEKQNKQE